VHKNQMQTDLQQLKPLSTFPRCGYQFLQQKVAGCCWRKKVLKYFFIPARDLIFAPLWKRYSLHYRKCKWLL